MLSIWFSVKGTGKLIRIEGAMKKKFDVLNENLKSSVTGIRTPLDHYAVQWFQEYLTFNPTLVENKPDRYTPKDGSILWFKPDRKFMIGAKERNESKEGNLSIWKNMQLKYGAKFLMT